MAEQKLELTVRVNADTGAFEVVSQKLAQTGHQAKGTEDSFLGLSRGAKSLLASLGLIASVASVIKFFTDSVKAAEEENEAIRRLNFNLEANGISWQKNKDQVIAWAAQLQRATRFSDTEAIATLEKFVRVTGNLSQAQTASTLAMDLSVASGKSLQSTQEFLTNVLNNNERAMKQANVEFGAFVGKAKNTQEVLDILSEKFTGAAQKEESFTKGVGSLSKEFGDLKETIGNAVMPIIEKLAKAIAESVAGWNLFLQIIQRTKKEIGEPVQVKFETAQVLKDYIKHLETVAAKTDEANKTTIGKQIETLKKEMAEMEAAAPAKLTVREKANEKEVEAEQKKTDEIISLNRKISDELKQLIQSDLEFKITKAEEEFNANQLAIENSKLQEFGKNEALAANAELFKARMGLVNNALAESVISNANKGKDAVLKTEKEKQTEAEKTAAKEKFLAEQKLNTTVSTLQRISTLQSAKSKELAAIGKAAAIALILIDTQVAIVKAFAQLGPLFGTPAAALMGAAGAVAIANVAGVELQRGGLVEGSAGGTAAIIGERGRDEAVIPLEDRAATRRIAEALGGGEAGAKEIVVNVNVNLSADTLALDDRAAVLHALAEEIGAETGEAVRFALRSKNLAERNAGLAV